MKLIKSMLKRILFALNPWRRLKSLRFNPFRWWRFRWLRRGVSLGLLSCTAALFALGITQFLSVTPEGPAITATGEVAWADEPIQPIPLKLEFDEAVVNLGNKLFHEPQLSSDGTISCASCHALDNGGGDGLAVSVGMGGHKTPLNSPTVFNVGFHSRQFWDGRAKTLEEQVEGPMASVGEMGGMTWQEVLARLERMPEYQKPFRDAYDGEISIDTVKDAIATFQRSLYTPNSPFDQYLRGDTEAISDTAKAGYDLFKAYGCVSCHQGVAVGGNMFQTLGIFNDYFADRGTPVIEADLGRYNVTGNELDRHVFKVPSLRNVALTHPYFHDGHAETLDDAIKMMGKYQLGVDMPQEDVDQIMQF
ncbi:MAG: cytochrome c peroxidase, partial [Cyanobacteria bacterium J06632_3]